MGRVIYFSRIFIAKNVLSFYMNQLPESKIVLQRVKSSVYFEKAL